MFRPALPALLILLLVSGAARAEASEVLQQLTVSFDIPSSRVTGTLNAPVQAGARIAYDVAGLTIDGVSLNGAPVAQVIRDHQLLVEATAAATLEVRFHAAFPQGSGNIIAREGISLTGIWYPRPVLPGRIELRVVLPAGYEAVSEAERIEKASSGRTVEYRFHFDHARENVSLAASDRYHVTRDRLDGVELFLYSLSGSQTFAKTRLADIKEYLAQYQKALGNYPYARFSLIENLLPTTVSRPTFLLVGQEHVKEAAVPTLGRLLLTQWFGSSVLVDREKGNWAEGLATYLVDHAAAESQGRGWEFRKDLLLQYASAVNSGNELSLREFRDATNAATRAVGSAKGAMVFHMLRRSVKDDVFFDALRAVGKDHRGRTVSWEEIRTVFEKRSGKDLSGFFEQWIDRKGLPELVPEKPEVSRKAARFEATFVVRQKGDPYSFEVPALLVFREGSRKELLNMEGEKKNFTLLLESEPGRIEIDPDYDVARRLSEPESPPLLGTLLAQDKLVIVSSVSNSTAYAPIEAALKARGGTVLDAAGAGDEIIKNASVAVLGSDNPILARLFGGGVRGSDAGFSAVARKNPWSPRSVITVIDARDRTEAEAALPGLARYELASSVLFDQGRVRSSGTEPSQRGMTMELRERTVAIDLTTLRSLTDAVKAAAGSRIIYVGEYHDRFAHHAVQLDVIKSLHRKDARLAIGMEMFQRPFQQAVDDYISGAIDERAFLRRTEYFKRWVFDYNLYKPILDFARDNKIPVVALNQRKEITEKVSRTGLDSLTEEERREVPPQMDFSDSRYRDRLKAIFSQHKGPVEKNFDFFYQAQVLWDETMALSVDEFLQKNPGHRMVVIAGGGHLVYGSGIPKRAFRRNSLPYFIALNDGDADAEAANYLILPPPLDGMTAPKLMAALKVEDKRVSVIDLPEDSVSKKAGIKPGDVILTLDNEPVESIEDIKIFLFYKQQGDRVNAKVIRKRFFLGDKEMDIEVVL